MVNKQPAKYGEHILAIKQRYVDVGSNEYLGWLGYDSGDDINACLLPTQPREENDFRDT